MGNKYALNTNEYILLVKTEDCSIKGHSFMASHTLGENRLWKGSFGSFAVKGGRTYGHLRDVIYEFPPKHVGFNNCLVFFEINHLR